MKLLVSNCVCSNPADRFDANQVLTVAEKMTAYFFQNQRLISSNSTLNTNSSFLAKLTKT